VEFGGSGKSLAELFRHRPVRGRLTLRVALSHGSKPELKMKYPIPKDVPPYEGWPTILLIARFKLAVATCIVAAAVLPAFLKSSEAAGAAIWATVFLAAMLSSVVGFAFSAIAGAIVFHIDASYLHAVQTMLVASISLQAYGVIHLWRCIDQKALGWFLAGGVTTLPIGVYIALHAEPKLLLLMIGTFILIYGLYTLSGVRPKIQAKGVIGDFIAGAAGGLTGPVAAFPGPFVTIWLSLKSWDKTIQRGVAQPYILIMQVLTLAALAAVTETRTAFDWRLLQYIVPALGGARIGLSMFDRLNERQFLSLVAVFLTLSGLAMIARAF
jgi:uncharacterized protein